MNDLSKISGQSGKSIVAGANKVSVALSAAARQLTFQNRSRRNLYRLANLTPRVRDRVFSILLILSFVFIFLVPFASSILYLGFFASPKYESTTRFVLRSAVPALSRDRFGGAGARPSPKIIQDTQIVVNFLTSQEFVKYIQKVINFEELYSHKGIDYFSRLEPGASREKLLDYWEKQISTWIKPKSGIVEIRVRAFAADEAQRLLQETILLSEQRVNQMNQGIWTNLIVASENDFQSASSALEKSRQQIRDIQNSTGVFDVEQTAEGFSEIITQLNSDIAQLKSREQVLSQSLLVSSASLTSLRYEIEAKQKQVAVLSADIAGKNNSKESTLAGYSELFQKARLDQELAEERFSNAVRELERIKLISSLQLVYLDKFIEPTLPETNKYPRVLLMTLLSFFGCLIAWGITTLVLIFARAKLD